MRLRPTSLIRRVSQRAFTLVELIVATAISVVLGGSVVLLLVQAAQEQRNGYSDTTVEEAAFLLEANITSALRSMSSNQGLSPITSSLVTNGIPNAYNSVLVFAPSNGLYITASITYSPSTGQVTYVPNTAVPTTQVIWMTNSPSAALTELYFSSSQNLDGSFNTSLVNVVFEMTDNGFSQQGTVNNPTVLFRNFSVQMRSD
jgi:prepilin-type N-terminal cleavage/methylation domain-containing protein